MRIRFKIFSNHDFAVNTCGDGIQIGPLCLKRAGSFMAAGWTDQPELIDCEDVTVIESGVSLQVSKGAQIAVIRYRCSDYYRIISYIRGGPIRSEHLGQKGILHFDVLLHRRSFSIETDL